MRIRLTISALAATAALALGVVAAPAASADTNYRLPNVGSNNCYPLTEPTAVWVDANVSGHYLTNVYLGNTVTGANGSLYVIGHAAIRLQYWDGSKYVSYWGFDTSPGSYGYKWIGQSANRGGYVYFAVAITLPDGRTTSARYRLN